MGLLDEVVKGVNTGIKQVGDTINKVQNKSQEMMHNASQESRIRSLEAKKAVALENLGKLIYDKYEKGDEVGDDVLKRKTTEIAEYDKEIELLKQEVAQYKAEHDPDLPQSHKSENKAGYSRTPGFECPHCKAPANSDKLFCAFCGGELRAEKKENGSESASSESGAAADEDDDD